MQKDLKKDFGAVGNGRTNDQPAFQRAADFFNKRALTPAGAGHAVLRIPAGTYLVGDPGAGSVPNVLALMGCRNLRIVGDDSATTEIRYAQGLRYGSFDPATKLPFEAATAYFTEGSYGVSLGTTIVLQRCDNVEVANIMLNGSSAHLVVGGHWGDTGIQLAADGVFVSDSRRITLRRLAVHHFGRDGIQVLNHLAKSLDDPNQEGIVLENSTFDYNGRQGLSITGVNGLRAINCSFSHTGRVVIPALGKALFSNPGAGVDIEPEGGFASHVRLAGCRFVDNVGQGLVSDHYGDAPPITKGIVLTNCLLWGVTNWSAWIRQPDFLFENCRFYGAFVNGCAQVAGATRFVGCTFEDRPYRGQAAYGVFLVHSDKEARRMSFTGCHFIGHHSYLLLARPAAPDTASAFRLRGCTFSYDYGSAPPLGSRDQLLGAMFSGNNVLESSMLPSDGPRLRVLLGDSTSRSPTVVHAPGSLRLAAANGDYTVRSDLIIGWLEGTAHGAARVEVAAGNVLIINGQIGGVPELYIGPTSQLVLKKGGALVVEARTKVLIEGQLVVEEGAYFYQDPQAKVSKGAQGQLRLAPGAIRGRPPVPTASLTPAASMGK
ncbi:hypothetical protein GCM10027422_26210 [Hymenobacter arcticus]